MAEIKQIFEKEKYMDLILEADPDKEIVEKYIKDAEMYGLFENEKILAEIIITKVDNSICELKTNFSFLVLTYLFICAIL